MQKQKFGKKVISQLRHDILKSIEDKKKKVCSLCKEEFEFGSDVCNSCSYNLLSIQDNPYNKETEEEFVKRKQRF